MTGIFKINNNEVFGSDGTFSGTIGNATFPAGKILQVVYADRTGKSNKSITTHSTYVDADLNTGTITQKQTGSKILVEACVTMAPSGFTSAFYRSGFFTWNTSSSGNYGGTNSQIVGKSVSAGIAEVDSHQYPATTGKWYVDTPSSSFTIYLTFYANAGSGTYVGGGNYHTSLTVYEIAQ